MNSSDDEGFPSEHVGDDPPVVDEEEVESPKTATSSSKAASPTTKARTSGKKTKSSKKSKTQTDGGSDVEDGDDSLSRCLVYCRLRPTIKKDFKEGGHNLVALEGTRVAVKDERHYEYDGTFSPDAQQEEVFEAVAIPCIEHAFRGFCSALMCYGQTGTGKSYTMCNTAAAHLGIIPRAASFIFNKINAESAQGSSRVYKVVGQFVQIYRDHLGDLMVNDGKDRVDIHYDTDTGVSLTGCTSHKLSSAKEFMKFYNEGNGRRVVGATAMNAESSRGHTAMIVWISSEDPEDPMKGRVRGKVTFIDLAGYERFSKTGITNADPIRKDEAKTINASLLALGHVVSSLSAGSKHIPWRNAKLTRILQDSIGGRSRTSIILTIGPSSEHLYETTNTLQFGLRARAVKVEAKASVTVDYVKLAKKLMGLLSERDERISVLELQIASRDAERQETLDRYQRDRGELEERFTAELEKLTTSGASEEQIRNLKEVYQAEVQNLQDQQEEEIGYQDEIHSKEISKLIKEQKHEEAKSLTAMKVAQERLMEEFQNKLDNARGGTNEDLVKALKELSEKDAVLASRANDTARLHATIEALTEQVRELGGTVSVDTDFPETYLDISQVEDMQTHLKAEVDRNYNKMVDLRTQLDRATMLAHDRMDEVGDLQEEVTRLREKLVQAGVEMTESNEELQRLRDKRSELIDPEELESLRLLMQADIDDLRTQRDDLESELKRVNEARVREALIRRRGQRDGPEALKEVLGEDGGAGVGDADSAGGKGGGKAKAMQKAYKKMIQKLNRQLSESSRAMAATQQRLASMERVLAAQGLTQEAIDAMTRGVGGSGSLPASPVDGDVQKPPASGDDPEDSMTEASLLATGNADVALLLMLKEQEIDVQDDLISQLENQLTKARSCREYDQKLVQLLTAQIRELGQAPQEPIENLQPVESIPLEDFTTLLRQARRHNRRLIVRMLTMAEGKKKSVSEAEAMESALKAEEELEERDTQLELKDELLLEKGAMLQYVAKLSARLLSQMETLGITPCCQLPESYQELAKTETSELGVQAEKQRELEARLEREQDEKSRMNRLLDAFNAEREHQAAVLRQTERRNKELQEREYRTSAEMHKLVEEKTKKEVVLEEATRRATRELMEMQARLARQETERKTNVFERLFGKFLD